MYFDTFSGKEGDNAATESIKQLDPLHKRVKQLNSIKKVHGPCGDPNAALNVVSEAMTEQATQYDKITKLLQKHDKKMCRTNSAISEHLWSWAYSLALLVFSCLCGVLLVLSRFNYESFNYEGYGSLLRWMFWILFGVNMYNYGSIPYAKYMSGEYDFWETADAWVNNCGFTFVDYGAFWYYDKWVRKTEADRKDALIAEMMEKYFKEEETKKEQKKIKNNSKSWQEILYQHCMLGKFFFFLKASTDVT